MILFRLTWFSFFLGCVLSVGAQNINLKGEWIFPPGDTALFVRAQGSNAFVATTNKLKIINLSQASKPVLVGETTIAVGTAKFCGLAVDAGYAYILCSNQRIYVVKISDPATPAVVGSALLTANFASSRKYGITVAGDRAYIAGGYRLSIVNVSNRTAPVEIGVFDTGTTVWDVKFADNLVYAAADSKVAIIDVTDPAHAWRVGEATVPATSIALDGN